MDEKVFDLHRAISTAIQGLMAKSKVIYDGERKGIVLIEPFSQQQIAEFNDRFSVIAASAAPSDRWRAEDWAQNFMRRKLQAFGTSNYIEFELDAEGFATFSMYPVPDPTKIIVSDQGSVTHLDGTPYLDGTVTIQAGGWNAMIERDYGAALPNRVRATMQRAESQSMRQ